MTDLQSAQTNSAASIQSDNLWADMPRRSSAQTWLILAIIAVVVIISGIGALFVIGRSSNSLPLAATPTESSSVIPSTVATSIPSITSPDPSIPVAFVTTPQPTTSICTLPTTQDSYLGLQVGVPSKWSLMTQQGTLLVRRDDKNTVVGFVYPAYLKQNVDPQDFIAAYFVTLQAAFEKQGGKLELDGDKLTGSFKGTSLLGGLRQSMTGRKVIVYGGWAPATEWPQLQETILSIGSCYQASAGTLLKIQNQTGTDDSGSTNFQFDVPETWQVTNLTSHGLLLASADGSASLKFVYQTNGLGDQTLDGLADTALANADDTDVKFVGETVLPNVTDSVGTDWTMKAKEYSAMSHGQSIHGVVTVALATNDYGYGYGTYSMMTDIRQTKAADWEKLDPMLQYLQNTLVLTDTKPGKSVVLSAVVPATSPILDATDYQQELINQVLTKADNLILGFATVRSPSIHDSYHAPRTTYRETGSSGAGYYRSLPNNQEEKLDIVKP